MLSRVLWCEQYILADDGGVAGVGHPEFDDESPEVEGY